MISEESYTASRSARAEELFLSGANCAQAVAAAFAAETGLTEAELLRLASGFGGGMARLREVCGALSGMFLAADLICGYAALDDKVVKDAHYAFLQTMASRFRERAGALTCRELLGLPAGASAPVSTPRTPAFYQERPCLMLVKTAAGILASELFRRGLNR